MQVGAAPGATLGANTFTGAQTIGVQQTSQGALILANTAAGAFATIVKSSNSATEAWVLTLPTSNGDSGQVLTTDGNGVTSWTTISSGVTVDTTVITGGTGGRLLWDNGGTVGETVGASYNSTTRTLTLTPTGANSALVLTGGTVTASAPVFSMTQTWNNSGVVFTGLLLTITNTASSSGSKVVDLKVGSTSMLSLSSTGSVTVNEHLGAPNGGCYINADGEFNFAGTRVKMTSPADSRLLIQNAAGNNFDRLQFGGTTSAFPALRRTTTALNVRLADDSADGAITASSGTFSTTLATAAPAGSSAGLWKLGALQTAAVVLDTTRSIFVDIGGTVYKLMVAQ